MSGFATIDALQSAADPGANGNGTVQHVDFLTSTSLATVASGIPFNVARGASAGYTGVLAFPTTGIANGRVPTNATTGALRLANPATGNNLYLTMFGAYGDPGIGALTTIPRGTLLLVDRIADVAVDVSAIAGGGAQTLTGVTATSRLATGEGAQLLICAATALSAAVSTMTFGYTNQAGTAGRTTQSIVTTASQPQDYSANSNLWQPLASGDSGIRSLQSITLTGTSVTGTLGIMLVRPLARVPLLSAQQSVEVDYAVQLPRLKRVYASSCLQLVYLPSDAITAGLVFGGVVRLAEG